MLTHDELNFTPGYQEKMTSEAVNFFVYFIFLFIMTIIATNLLTGLAVDDIEQIRRKAETQRLAMVIDRALHAEYSMPDNIWILKYLYTWIKNRGVKSFLIVKKEHGGNFSRIFGSARYLAKDIDISDLESSCVNPLWVPQQDEDIADLELREEAKEQQCKLMKDVEILKKDIEDLTEENEKIREDNESMKKMMQVNNEILKKLQHKLL